MTGASNVHMYVFQIFKIFHKTSLVVVLQLFQLSFSQKVVKKLNNIFYESLNDIYINNIINKPFGSIPTARKELLRIAVELVRARKLSEHIST